MCGIAGIISRSRCGISDVEMMLKGLRHRGPDGVGKFSDRAYSGGMTRLAINDIENGNQPFYNDDYSIIVFYNGEIYNHLYLRRLLKVYGKHCKVSSDGAVIPYLYELFGEDVFSYLDGMFAVSIWDSKNCKLIISRDSSGEKPLYYYRGHREFLFGSELKSFRSLNGLDLGLNRQAIWDFPTFLWIPEPETIYDNIFALERGSYLIYEDDKVIIKKYANRNLSSPPECIDDASISKWIEEAVVKSVLDRCMSEAPIGSFLSGGLDSAIIAAIVSKKYGGGHLSTFTVGFDSIRDPYHGFADESNDAGKLASILGTNHHTVLMSQVDFRKLLDDFCYYGDQPFAVSSGLGILALSRVARDRGVKVLLSGDGADEYFGGYSWYPYMGSRPSRPNVSRSRVTAGHRRFHCRGESLTRRIERVSRYTPSLQAWAWHYYASEEEKTAVFSDGYADGLRESTRYFSELTEGGGPMGFIRHDRRFYFPNEMLTKIDRMTMAASVEGRAPFAAPAIHSLAEHLGLEMLIRNGKGKYLLRNAFRDYLPHEVLARRKHGFNVPIDSWLSNEWTDLVEDTFSTSSALAKNQIISTKSFGAVKSILANKNSIPGHTIFSFMMLNKWLELKS